MNWFYWGSLALVIAVTLQLTDRRRWLTGYFVSAAIIGLALAAYRTVSNQASPLWQFIIVGLKLVGYLVLPILVLVVALSFIRYSYRLIRKEGWHLHYSLLAIVGVLLVTMLGLLALNGLRWRQRWLWELLGLAVVLTAYFAAGFLAYLVAGVTTRLGRRGPVDAIIVLGAGLMPDGRPTRTLSYRLKAAAKFYRGQRAQHHQPIKLIVSGGQGADEIMAESTAMRQYLVALGIPVDVIQEENQSTSTLENLKFSHTWLVKRQPFYRAVVVTSDYHVLRANILARRLRLNMVSRGARTPWYYVPFAMFREYLALIVLYHWANIVAVIGLTLVYGAWLVKLI
ncbi:YdcF family protein [Lactobacillus sp. CBA3606]|uniref:YdcF family protein n=1 Tax=Lactobacillus sp. CBA3606 TaxID=2099789 RepID=UPI000CFC5A0A|nr:YdcF family protein [Lactobacillus sp. CBA3606]AVK64379.1 YdcF family protein [Lactobacillus sp. CBA3606]